MSVVKVIEVLSSSKKSWEDATASAIVKASKSVKNIKSAWVKDQSVTCLLYTSPSPRDRG